MQILKSKVAKEDIFRISEIILDDSMVKKEWILTI